MHRVEELQAEAQIAAYTWNERGASLDLSDPANREKRVTLWREMWDAETALQGCVAR